MRRHLDYSHTPIRGSDVERWIMAFRARHPGTPWAATLTELLNDYQIRADCGLELADDTDDAGESGADSFAGRPPFAYGAEDCDCDD